MNKIYLFILFIVFQNGILAQGHILVKTDGPIINHSLVKTEHILFKVVLLDEHGYITYKLVNDNNIIVDSTTGEVIVSKLACYKNTIFENKSVYDLKTFSPITFDEFNTPLSKKVDEQFKRNGVVVNSLIKNITMDSLYHMPEGYFDDNVIEMQIGYFRLKKNVKYVLNAFRFESNGNNPYEIEYLFDDLLPSGNNNFIKCRIVKFKNSYLNGFLWFDYVTGNLLKEIGKSKERCFIVERI